MQVRSILNKSVSKRQLSLAYSINPYRGCEFGCRYCYARYTHEFLVPKDGVEAASDQTDFRDPDAFEKVIFIKKNAAWLLEQELRKIDPADEIALGTATDPYQPIERHARVTRSLLEVFARRAGYRLGIVTKSALIERDIDLLAVIAERNTLVVHLTITTEDVGLRACWSHARRGRIFALLRCGSCERLGSRRVYCALHSCQGSLIRRMRWTVWRVWRRPWKPAFLQPSRSS